MNSSSILNRIVADKRAELAAVKRLMPLAALKERCFGRQTRGFKGALRGKGVRLIAEAKKASPSKGVLRPDYQPAELARAYAAGGAAAVSVLTESHYFQGKLEHLTEVRQAVSVPVLRKDFIFDSYQIYESAAFSADAVLLIAAVLTPARLEELLGLAAELRLDCLVEVHNEAEMQQALLAGAGIVGINNRDLATFKTDLNVTRRLRLLVPEDVPVVSESGIRTRADMKKIRECRVDAVLVGEALVTAPDIPAALKELLS